MRISVQQAFPFPVAAIERVLFDSAFLASLRDDQALGTPELLAHSDDGVVVRHELRYQYRGDLPAGAGRFVDADRLSWVHHTIHDRRTHTSRWSVHPDHYASLLSSAGTAVLESTPSGSLRRTEGELAVRIPMLGRRVERAIADGLVERASVEQPLVVAWLDRDQDVEG